LLFCSLASSLIFASPPTWQVRNPTGSRLALGEL